MQDMELFSSVHMPGRFVFRVDEWIQPGGCLDINFVIDKKLEIWPRYANMLGGQEVNITGPCFDNNFWFHCKWGDNLDAPITIGEVEVFNNTPNMVHARCVQPMIYYTGILNLSISLDGGKTYDWKAEYTIGKKKN